MIALIFFALAAIFNAFMDTISEGRFGRSIFKDWDPRFWYDWQSWKYAKKIFNYPLDAWHIAKSLMWASCGAAALTYEPIFPYWWLNLGVIGTTIILTFNLFYNHIFRKP
jgi:hypothetical protein